MLGHVPVLATDPGPVLYLDWVIVRAQAIVPASAIARHAPTLAIARIGCRIDSVTVEIVSAIGWRIEAIVRRTAATTGTTGTVGITTITITGITATGTATGDQDHV